MTALYWEIPSVTSFYKMEETEKKPNVPEKKADGDISDILNNQAINHVDRIARAFMLLPDYAERYVKFMNQKKNGITVAEVVEDLIYTWPPTRVYQDW